MNILFYTKPEIRQEDHRFNPKWGYIYFYVKQAPSEKKFEEINEILFHNGEKIYAVGKFIVASYHRIYSTPLKIFNGHRDKFLKVKKGRWQYIKKK